MLFKIQSLLKTTLGWNYVENISLGKFNDVILLKLPSGESKAGKIVWGGQIKKPQTDVWPRLDHKNIVRLENTILMPDIEACLFVMTPQYTTLEKIVKSEDFRSDEFSMFDLKRWLLDALSGTSYLHEKNICHLNIKASNIMISYDSRAKLGGFGLATSSWMPVSGCGIEYPYHPPELCHSRRRDVLVDPVGVDLWSLGMLTLQIFTQNKLGVEMGNNIKIWSEEVYKEIFKEMKDLEWNIEMSFPEMEVSLLDLKRLKNFIRMFLYLKPGHRPSAKLAMQHKFLSSGLLMPKVDPVWKKKATRVNIEMIIEEHNTLDNVRKRCEGRKIPGSKNSPLKPCNKHHLIMLSESNKENEQARFDKNDDFFKTDASEESKNLLEKTLVVNSEVKLSAWDSIQTPVVEDNIGCVKKDNLIISRGGGKDIVSQRNQGNFDQEKTDISEKKKKGGIFAKTKTWFLEKFRSFQKS